MNKKFLIGICTLALMFGMTGCGKEPTEVAGFPVSQYESILKSTLQNVDTLDETTLDYYVSQSEESDDEISAEFFKEVQECNPLKGEFVKFYDNDKVIGGFNIGKLNIGGQKAFAVEKSGKTVTASLVADYSKRDLKLTFVYNANDIKGGPTAINIEPIYSLGETMQKAGLNTVMGIAIVFCMLVLMSGVIKVFEIIPKIEKSIKAKKEAQDSAPVVEPVATKSSNDSTDDLQLVAVIAAAIAASTGASTDSFVVRSIKKR